MTGLDAPELGPETAEVLQAAKRVLAGVALRSLNVLDGAVTLPQFRMLAVLGDLGQARSAQVARALGLDASTVTRLARPAGREPPPPPRRPRRGGSRSWRASSSSSRPRAAGR